MPDAFTCARRHDAFAFPGDVEGADTWRADGTCSYCGSISPDAFFAAVEAGREIGPTDKHYKAYVDLPEQSHAKFYFQHLDEDERRRFIDLLNAGTMNIGYPGYFYRLPFFAAPV